jgi:hypothetical protein
VTKASAALTGCCLTLAPCLQDVRQQPARLAALPGSITSLSWQGPGGAALLAGTAQGCIYSVELATAPAAGAALLQQAQQGALLGLSFAADLPGAVATCCADGTVCIWSMQVR